jgi:hypothetical protein
VIAPNLLPIDVDALLAAPPAEKIATMTLWHESVKPSNTQSLRDECSRGVGRFLIYYLLPTATAAAPATTIN